MLRAPRFQLVMTPSRVAPMIASWDHSRVWARARSLSACCWESSESSAIEIVPVGGSEVVGSPFAGECGLIGASASEWMAEPPNRTKLYFHVMHTVHAHL